MYLYTYVAFIEKETLRSTIYILTFFVLLMACNSKSDNIKSEPTKQNSKTVESNKFEKSTQNTLQTDNTMICDFVYDTITNKRYNVHLGILEKFHGKGSDTCDLVLWHKFEESNPDIFIEMYQFSCQKL